MKVTEFRNVLRESIKKIKFFVDDMSVRTVRIKVAEFRNFQTILYMGNGIEQNKKNKKKVK